VIVFGIAYWLVTLPFRGWCQWRHRRQWIVDGPGYGWVCTLDGIPHGFSEADIRDLTAGYLRAGENAAKLFLEDTEAVETFFGERKERAQ
jgi:hypothetical protein